MSENEWYVIDRFGTIVNCVTTSTRERAEQVTKGMEGGPYTVTNTPTRSQLQNYRYWNERP